MSIAPLPPDTPLSTGRLLGDSLAVYKANFVSFSFIVAMAFAPLFLWSRFGPEIIGYQNRSNVLIFSGVTLALALFLPFMAQGALVFGAVEYMRGRKVGIGAAVGRGIKTLLPVLGVALLGGLATAAPLIIGGFLSVLIGLIGLVALIIAAMFTIRFMTNFWVAVPAAVFEKQGVVESLKRSNWLVMGSRMAIFGTWIVLFLMGKLSGYILERALDPGSWALLGSLWAANSIFGSVQAVSSAVAYTQLRESKEGVDAEELANIFS